MSSAVDIAVRQYSHVLLPLGKHFSSEVKCTVVSSPLTARVGKLENHFATVIPVSFTGKEF